MKLVTFTIALSFACSLSIALGSSRIQDKKTQSNPLAKKDTRVEPTSWGVIEGRIYDADTGSPIPNASVSVETDQGFMPKGRSTSITGDLGEYRAGAVLGRISNNLDVGRALFTSGIGLLFGAATNTTKRIDVSQVNIKASAIGYKPFEGTVVARSQDANRFCLTMEPILLVPDGGVGISISATSWSAVRISSVRVDPMFAKKGQIVTLSADVVAFGKHPGKTVEISAVSELWTGERKLHLDGIGSQAGSLTFSTTYKVSSKEKRNAIPVFFYISRSDLDFDPNRSGRFALVQTPETEVEMAASKLRVDAISRFRERNANGALHALSGIPTENRTDFDREFAFRLAENVGNWTEAAEFIGEVPKVSTNGLFKVSARAKILYNVAKYAKVCDLVEPILKGSKRQIWPRLITSSTIGFYGMSLLHLNMLEKAQQLNQNLLDWPTSGLEESVIEFRSMLRLAEVESLYQQSPNSPAYLADYGRALLDLGRFDEAVARLKESLDKDPTQQAVRRDLVWASLHYEDKPLVSYDLTAAVQECKEHLNIGKGKQQSKDFIVWNQYALMLYALSEQQRGLSSSDAAATLVLAIDSLREALSLARVGATRVAGPFTPYGYLEGSVNAISGFAYPQANFGFQLLESLKRLNTDPTNELALLNESTSLLKLGQFSLARESICRLLGENPTFSEANFILSMIALKQGHIDEAKILISKVLEANPRHPTANLELSQILAGEGDIAGAASCLTSHATFYGEVRKRN